MKIQIGQTVYIEPTGNARRYSKEIIETKVSKVGRKYFEVDNIYTKFDLETMCDVSECCSDYYVYLSKQEIEDKKEKEKINKYMQEVFGSWGFSDKLSLEQLRQIQNIIVQNNDVET